MREKLRLHRIWRAALAIAFCLPMASGAIHAASGNGEGNANGKSKFTNNAYIVQLLEQPVTAYTGGISGYPATKPNKGQKIDPNSSRVANYKNYLQSRHDAVLASVSGGRKLHSYGYVFNGFAAELSQAQAETLAASPGVLAVTKDTIAPMDTVSTPTFLGLNKPGGIWSVLSGNANGNPITANGPNSGGAGEGVVVGIIDSGIWPENPSFSDRDEKGKLVFQQIPGWHGKCVPGEAFNGSDCNKKLIAAQWFNAGFGGDASVKVQFPYEFASARAADGHGVHTASTAAGNFGVEAVADGINLGRISGMAPRARVAVYKVCWGIAPEGGCFNSDSVAAIDQAVADGVDVINYSISGTSTNFRDPVEIAFLFAADAGVFVAASAGNAGPTASTVAHPSPWIATVAASSHDRFYQGTVTLGNAASYTGASLTAPVGPAPIVNSSAVGLVGKPASDVARCFLNALDPALVAGKIVVCDRGVNNRVEKSQEVKRAGGVGMVLVNVTPNSLNADLHSVPTVHLADTDRPAVNAYAATAGATASLSQGVVTAGVVNAPLIASFSSRGPLRAGDGNLLKPDITAPGVDVLAAYSPVAGGHDFEFLSGTSMSSPHMAGLAALMKDAFPTWSPMAIKSALMTTAYQTVKSGPATGAVFSNPFGFGAGHVEVNKALNPGLVFDSGFGDWLGFLCGTQLPTSFCTSAGVPVLNPSNLNVPSIAIGAMAGSQTVTRRVTNVSRQSATFTAVSSGLAGITVSLSPNNFTLNAGQSQLIQATFTNVSAPLNLYRDGAIVWTSNFGHVVRIPTVIRPVALSAPLQVSGSYNVTFGYNGAFTATARGLIPAAVTPGTVSQDPDQTFVQADPTGTVAIPVTIPAGTTYARYSLFDADVTAGTDLDLYVYQGASLVGVSASGTSAEEVNFSFGSPTAAAIPLTVYVHGWGVAGGGSSPFKLHGWYLGTAAAGNMTVTAPASATLGATGAIGLTFSGLTAGTKYLGSVAYGGIAGLPNPTIVRVDP